MSVPEQLGSSPHERNNLGQPIGLPVDRSRRLAAPPFGEMVGRYCRLEALDARRHGAELHAAYAAASDIGDWTYLPYGPFEAAADQVEFLKSVEGLDDPMFFTVLVDDVSVGVASFLRIDPRAGSIEVGHIHFSRTMQGTRAATEAMLLMMQRAFDAGYRRYEWKCDALNAPSRRAAQRLGFQFEGVFRQATTYKGHNRDTAWFSITDNEWPTLRTEFGRWLAPENFEPNGTQLSPLDHSIP